MRTDIIIAGISTLTALTIVVISVWATRRQHKIITRLKQELACRKEKETAMAKWWLAFGPDTEHQSITQRKLFLHVTRQLQERLRSMIDRYEQLPPATCAQNLYQVKQEISHQYFRTRIYFDNTVTDQHALSIKSNMLLIINKLLLTGKEDIAGICALLDIITDKQQEMQQGIEEEIQRLYYSLQTSINN